MNIILEEKIAIYIETVNINGIDFNIKTKIHRNEVTLEYHEQFKILNDDIITYKKHKNDSTDYRQNTCWYYPLKNGHTCNLLSFIFGYVESVNKA